MNATYRHSRHGALMLWVGIPFSLLLTCVFVVAARDAPHPVGAAVFGLVPMLFFVACIYSLLIVKYHQLIVSDSHIESQGIRNNHRISLDDVQEARWRCYGQTGRLTLRTAYDKLKVEFDNYDRETSRMLIRFFRFRLPPVVQLGWDPYWAWHWRCFDLPDMSDPAAVERETHQLCRRIDVIFAIGTLLAIAAAAATWWYTGQAKGFALVLLLLVLWPLSRRGTTPQGKIARTASCFREANVSLVVAVVLLALGFLTALLCGMFNSTASRVVGMTSLLVPSLFLFAAVLRQEMRQKVEKRQLARMAEEEYMVPLPGQKS
jgi:hypothetical protein